MRLSVAREGFFFTPAAASVYGGAKDRQVFGALGGPASLLGLLCALLIPIVDISPRSFHRSLLRVKLSWHRMIAGAYLRRSQRHLGEVFPV
ncbi:MAG: hypothetical protein ACE5MK_08230 [Acidobacteriota bacterium]